MHTGYYFTIILHVVTINGVTMSIFNTLRGAIDSAEQLVNDFAAVREARREGATSQRTGVAAPVARTVNRSGLTLTKGQRITLEKNGQALTNVCVGINWGMIQGTFGRESVDLDVSCVTFNGSRVDETVYYGRLQGTGIKHSGDDLTGDSGGDDGLDNEIITLDLKQIKSNVDQIFIILNSYRGHRFDKIPYATIRIYEGTPTRVDNVIATYDIANDTSFKNSVSMVMGKLYRKNNEWRFNAIGNTTSDSNIAGITKTITEQYL